jgi:hypothetical protein
MKIDIRKLEDKQAIYTVLAAVCRSLDRCDIAGLVATMRPDATNVDLEISGRDAISAAMIAKVVEESDVSTHFLSNVLIDIDGDRANVEAYLSSYLVTLGGENCTVRTRSGRYLDQLQREGTGWLISSHSSIVDWATCAEYRTVDRSRWQSGSRSISDPSYDILPIVCSYQEHDGK